MQDLMKTNCYDVGDTMIVVGSCLPRMQSKAYTNLKNISSNIYDVCLESTHLNMTITKILGMLCRVNVKTLIFASVDKSPHCIQLHYVESEIRKAMKMDDVKVIHYVAVNDELVEIESDTINKSKSLSELQKEKA